MAIAIDGSSPVRFTGTPNNNVDITSASFTAPANSVLVCCVSADTNGASENITISVSDSGSLTWTNRVERDPGDAGAEAGHASIWTAVQTTSASRTVSVRRTAGNGSTNRISVKVYVVTGADTTTPTGATGEGSSTTNNITPNAYTSTVNNSRGFGCGDCWNQLGTPTSSDTEDAADYSGAISVISLHKAADTATSGSTVTINFDAGGTGAAAWNWTALEILPGSGEQTVSPTGTDVAVQFGSPSVSLNLSPSGTDVAVQFGTPSVTLNLSPTGTDVAVQFGSPSVTLNVSPGGTDVNVQFGSPTVSVAGSLDVTPAGTDVAVQFGSPSVSLNVSPGGTDVLVQFGSPTVSVSAGEQTVSPSSTIVNVQFGVPVITGGTPTDASVGSLFTATVILSNSVGVSLWDLIQGALGTFRYPIGDRIFWLVIEWGSGTFYQVYKEGVVVLGTDAGFQFSDTTGRRKIEWKAPTHNQISLKEVYLAGSVGGEQAKISAWII